MSDKLFHQMDFHMASRAAASLLLCAGLALCCLAWPAHAQIASTAPQGPRLSFDIISQSYQFNENERLSQLSTPISLRLPVGQRSVLSLHTTSALTSGPGVPTFGGIGDVRINGASRIAIGPGDLVLGARVSLPLGSTELTPERFQTTVLFSRDHFQFRTPVYGQALSIAPSVLYAFPLGENVALGVGFRYHYRDSYRPVADMEDAFNAGDDIAVTAGLDVRLARSWDLSLDAVYTWYDEDAVGDQSIFAAGDQLIAGASITGRFGMNQLILSGRYRERGRPEIPQLDGSFVPALRTVSDFVTGRLAFVAQPTGWLSLEGRLGGRFYDASDITERLDLVDVGVLPRVSVSEEISLRGRFIYTAGTFAGFEAGVGISAVLR